MDEWSDRTRWDVDGLGERRTGPLGACPHLKQVLCHQRNEMPLCWIGSTVRQVVGQLVVDTGSVNRLELERSGDHPLIQSANLVVENLGDHSTFFVDVQHCGHIVGLDQH